MPITISYDLQTDDTNHRNYIRSMFERFGWKRLGGSVLRYEDSDGLEDWLNDVVPALMLFRSYVIAKDIKLKFFTLDTNSVARIDLSDPQAPFGNGPDDGDKIVLSTPTNAQSSEKRIRRAITSMVDLFKPAPSPEQD
jgi:hypothetical protein